MGQPYSPLHVYKALIKIGISVLQQPDMIDFVHCLKYLMTEDYDNQTAIEWPVMHCIFPFEHYFSQPKVCIYKKKDLSSLRPTYLISIYAGCSMISFHIPFYQPDIYTLNKQKIQLAYSQPDFINDDREPRKDFLFVPYTLVSREKQRVEDRINFTANRDLYLPEENKFLGDDGKKFDASLLVGIQANGKHVAYYFKEEEVDKNNSDQLPK